MKKMFLASVMAVVAALFVGCGDVTSNESGAGNADGKAYLAVSVDVDTNVRSVAPQNVTLEDITKAELLYKKSGDTSAQAALLREWTSLQSVLAEKSLTIETGTYDFTLKLYKWTDPLDGTESQEVVTQTGTIANQVIKAGMNTLAFNTSYADGDGNLSIELTWTAEDRINKAEAGLFTVNANGSVGEELADFPVEELTIADGEYNATYTKSLPKGKYYLSFWFYQDSTIVKTWTDVVKIATGCNTTKTTELSHINTMYSITYDVGEGAWVGDAESTLIKTRNANTGVHLPESSAISHATNATKVLGGWYVLDDEDNPLLDEKGNPIELTDIGTGDDTAKDYKLRANFVYPATGNVSADNRALAISVSTTELRLNSTVTFSVKEADGSPVTDTVSYAAKLLYKGKDVNTLADAAGGDYYSLSENALSLVRKLPVTGDYQLYVTASRLISAASGNSVISSKTFDVEFINQPISLYADGNYYLVDSLEDYTDGMTPTLSSATGGTSAFDKAGNLYALVLSQAWSSEYAVYNYKCTIKSTNGTISADGVALSELDDHKKYDTEIHDIGSAGITIDDKTDILYGYGNQANYRTETNQYGTQYKVYFSTTQFDVYKYPSLVSGGSTDGVVTYTVNVEGYQPYRAVVHGGILYCVAKSATGDGTCSMMTFTLPDTGETFTSAESIVPITESLSLSKSADIIDMVYSDGAVYLIICESSSDGIMDRLSDDELDSYEGYDFYSRGVLIEYNTRTKAVRRAGLTSNTLGDFGIYMGGGEGEVYYADDTSGKLYAIPSTTALKSDDETLSKYFPTVHTPASLSEKAFIGPRKIIGIKPKQLVVTDGGTFFYTNEDGALVYKTVNRIVTVDLENFVIESLTPSSGLTFDQGMTDDTKTFLYFDYLRVQDYVDESSVPTVYYENYGYEPRYEAAWGCISGSTYLYMKKGE